MLKSVSIAVLALAAPSSLAGVLYSPGAGPVGQAHYGSRATYTLDDGAAESQVGLSGGGFIVGANQFDVVGGNNVLTSLEVTWGSTIFAGSSGLSDGDSFEVYVWADAVPGAGMTPGSLLYSGTASVSGAAIDSNVFQVVSLPNVVVPGAGFLIGVGVDHDANSGPLAIDTSSMAVGRSFVGGSTVGVYDPNLLPGLNGGAALDLGVINVGHLMIRANATTPAPGALALLGLGGLVATRRRR